jgi:hypothetical protein
MSEIQLTKKQRHLQDYIERKAKEFKLPMPGGRTLSRQRKNLSRRIARITPEGQKKHQEYLKRREKRAERHAPTALHNP